MTVNVQDQVHHEKFSLYNADCVDVMRDLPSDATHYSIFSPPFSSLFIYSASPRDFGNVGSHAEFFDQHGFMVRELYRMLMPGRLVSFHCMTMPTLKSRDGFVGLYDFRGDLIRQFQAAGFIFHSEVTIWKDPVVAMQRTKALGLLHQQLRKDGAMSRQGIADYLITMRKPGVNPEPVEHCGSVEAGGEVLGNQGAERIDVDLWQRYASPVWMDINQSDTLQFRSAREDADERHLAPLQLGVIGRALELWTRPGDTVFSPFTGIGSEPYVAVQMGRRGIGCELKESYYKMAVANLQAVANPAQGKLF